MSTKKTTAQHKAMTAEKALKVELVEPTGDGLCGATALLPAHGTVECELHTHNAGESHVDGDHKWRTRSGDAS